MPAGDVGRPSWHKPALAIALLLVVGQVVVFLILRSGKKTETSIDAGFVAANATHEASDDVLVLVLGPGTPSVSVEQVRNVYLGRTRVWPNGTTAQPLNRPADTTAAKRFYDGILRMNAGAFAEHWSDGAAPPTVSSGEITVARVAATSGGFSYVLESELPENTNGVRLVRLQ